MKLEKFEVQQIRRSKLEMYVDIMKVLANNGPLDLTQIMSKANFNYPTFKEYLGFLIKQGLAETRTIKKKSTVFAVTQRGITVLKQLRELTQGISVIEEV